MPSLALPCRAQPSPPEYTTHMKIVSIALESASPIGFSRKYEIAKNPKESDSAYEERTWRNRAHIDKEHQIYIPPMMFKHCYREIGAFLSRKIPGKGNATFSKHFKSGILIEKPIPLGIKLEEVSGERLFVPANGITGSGKRVMKIFPFVAQWSGTLEVYILDDTIDRTTFEEHTHEMGRFIGIGFWRPANGGLWGRFKALKFSWTEEEI
jgi:hypothetical protein